MNKDQLVVAITDMLQKQHDVNAVMNKTEDWVALDRPWYRAMWTEAAEIVTEWVDWEWWKKGEVSVRQAQLEIVDIWHFYLSHLLQNRDEEESFQDVAIILTDAILNEPAFSKPLDFPEGVEALCVTVERFINDTIEFREPDISYFMGIMEDLGLSFEALYTWYIGKNQLNHFRQTHGDKEGTYVRNWCTSSDGKCAADNAILETIVLTAIDLNIPSDKVAGYIHESLEAAWENHNNFLKV
jgi:hypothetical protein